MIENEKIEEQKQKKLSVSRLERSLTNFMASNKEGSFATHNNRIERLTQAMRTLNKELGYRHLKNIRDLKGRHVRGLVENWKEKGLSTGTIKNRMSDLRWIAKKIENPRIVERTNQAYGIENRKYVKNDTNIAKILDKSGLSKITDKRVELSLKMQEAFGLRREEAIKIQPEIADKGDKLELSSSWTKGGRAREIPIRTEQQRELLNDVKQFCRDNGEKSLIPKDSSYIQQLRSYEYQTEKTGIDKNHGLRHQYAQERYRELTGRECPKNGGLTSRKLSPEQKDQDLKARLTISKELGHNREEITAIYLGR